MAIKSLEECYDPSVDIDIITEIDKKIAELNAAKDVFDKDIDSFNKKTFMVGGDTKPLLKKAKHAINEITTTVNDLNLIKKNAYTAMWNERIKNLKDYIDFLNQKIKNITNDMTLTSDVKETKLAKKNSFLTKANNELVLAKKKLNENS